ncbi:hypothetical protein N9T73_00305, partial [bacterium]|nr:hypothetical protein [bacterium]
MQKGSAFDMSDIHINFNLIVSTDNLDLDAIKYLLTNSNVPVNSQIQFNGIKSLNPLKIPDWQIDGNVLTCNIQGSKQLHFYELIEVVKKRYDKYQLKFKSQSDFYQFFNQLLIDDDTQTSIYNYNILREYILRNIDVYINSKIQYVPFTVWKTYINELIQFDLGYLNNLYTSPITKAYLDKLTKQYTSLDINFEKDLTFSNNNQLEQIFPLKKLYLIYNESNNSLILLIGETHLSIDSNEYLEKYSDDDDTCYYYENFEVDGRNYFYDLLDKIINNYIKLYENTNFFLECTICIGKRLADYKKKIGNQYGSSYYIIDTIRCDLDNPDIKGRIHYTDIRQHIPDTEDDPPFHILITSDTNESKILKSFIKKPKKDSRHIYTHKTNETNETNDIYYSINYVLIVFIRILLYYFDNSQPNVTDEFFEINNMHYVW